MPFDFGTAGSKFPIKANEVWGVGEHKFACIDWLDASKVESAFALFGVRNFTTVYMDLPYNKGLATSFYTKANQAKKVTDDEFQKLLNASVALASLTQTYAIVEIGTAHAQELGELARLAGAITQRVAITYYKTRPSAMIVMNWAEQNYQLPDMRGMDDEHTPAELIRAVKNNLPAGTPTSVFDPCTGLGLTPLSAVAAGATAYGFELVPRRLSVTLSKMEKATKLTPQRIGAL